MNKNAKKRVWFYILVGVFFPLAMFLVFFIWNKDTKKDKNNSTTVIEESENSSKIKKRTESKQDIAYEALVIKAYEYPSEFTMGDNLKGAIVQLAITYDDFDQNVVKSEEWKETFITKFIQNSRLSFDYLDQIADKNNGKISISELNYIQYSLTDIKVDFSSYVKDTVDSNDTASALNFGQITDYKYEVTDEGVRLTADLEVGWDGTDSTTKKELTVNLIKNKYSCFDGYSIKSLSSKTVESKIKPDNKEHIFYGSDMMEEENGVFPFEFSYSEDDMNYAHFVYVDLSKLPELADLVRKNSGSDFKVIYVLNGGETDTIEKVVPTDITLADK
ncbi:hypothetical protein [Anaeromicropila herbilytica]|uniref:Uncharacterized protein n=1 Tax=Anaeromicropila herbilytica TaxID=2785025 RepID=A0A7R7ENM1_9FIRM|nr:hypothetical protein [Anaeromicropila herbilytica]BCN31906.1 hypothetical protein bsdtb5_32010 [Anaeromicropila herbilytica]